MAWEDEVEVGDDFIDLTEPVAKDTAAEFLETVEIPAQDMTEDSGEAADTIREDELDTSDEFFDLTEPTAEDEVADFLDTVEIPAQEMAEDSIEAAHTAREIDPDDNDAVTDFDIDEESMDLTEPDAVMEPDQEERIQETVELPTAGYEEDKELLELIDDIQATLNDEPVADRVSEQEGTPQADESIEADTLEKDADEYTFLDNDEFIEEEEIPESETEFVDHLGIDLTSEIERKALEEKQEAVLEDVKPTEKLEADITPGALEIAVKQALTEMLADENNPLAKAIENAVKKALGQGAES